MQQSDKHSPVVDDAMQDQRTEAPFGYKHDGAPEDGDVPADSVQVRSDLARFLGPAAFPGDRATLLTVARDNDAPEWVLGSLARVPDGRSFAAFEEVWEALGGQPD